MLFAEGVSSEAWLWQHHSAFWFEVSPHADGSSCLVCMSMHEPHMLKQTSNMSTSWRCRGCAWHVSGCILACKAPRLGLTQAAWCYMLASCLACLHTTALTHAPRPNCYVCAGHAQRVCCALLMSTTLGLLSALSRLPQRRTCPGTESSRQRWVVHWRTVSSRSARCASLERFLTA